MLTRTLILERLIGVFLFFPKFVCLLDFLLLVRKRSTSQMQQWLQWLVGWLLWKPSSSHPRRYLFYFGASRHRLHLFLWACEAIFVFARLMALLQMRQSSLPALPAVFALAMKSEHRSRYTNNNFYIFIENDTERKFQASRIDKTQKIHFHFCRPATQLCVVVFSFFFYCWFHIDS